MEKILILLLASLLLFEPPVLSHLICANQAVKIQSGNKKKPKKFGSYFLLFFFCNFSFGSSWTFGSNSMDRFSWRSIWYHWKNGSNKRQVLSCSSPFWRVNKKEYILSNFNIKYRNKGTIGYALVSGFGSCTILNDTRVGSYNPSLAVSYAATWYNSANHKCSTPYDSCSPWSYWEKNLVAIQAMEGFIF